MRWIDLSAYGMKLKVAALPNSKVLVIENVPEEAESAVKELGFKKRDSGYWINPTETEIVTRKYLRLLPKAKMGDFSKEDILLDLSQKTTGKNNETKAVSEAVKDIKDPVFLGTNRLNQRIYDDQGRRFLTDSNGRRVYESASSNQMAGMYLRALDANSLTMCADGYVNTLIRMPEKDWVPFDTYLENIGATDRKAFMEEVSKAGVRHLFKKDGAMMRDVFFDSLRLKTSFRNLNIEGVDYIDKVLVARRLAGLDKHLVGNSVYASGDGSDHLRKLLPKAVRTSHAPSQADIGVLLPDNMKEALKALDERKPDAMTILVVKVADSGEARSAVDKIASKGAIESASFINLPSSNRYIAVVCSVGSPSNDFEMGELNDEGEVWSWASQVASTRARKLDHVKTGLSTEDDLTFSDGLHNSHQVPYASASKVGRPKTMLPKELEEATRVSLDRLISNYGDVDDRVAVECGFPRGSVGDYLSPEQVDAVALQISAEERGRGFLLADNTGTGKGRALMAVAKRAILQGRKVLVLSEKPANLSDLMRDVKHIGALDVIKPAVVNRGVSLIDEEDGSAFETEDQEALYEAIENGAWPEGVSCIFSTYSQFNRAKENSKRSEWLHTAIDGDVLVVADEVHNAANFGSNTSTNILAAIEASGPPVMSSATYASDTKMIPFYESVFPEGISAKEIASMMRKGGEPFQEVVSSMLVSDGVMLRREKDLSSLKITQHLDVERLDENKKHMDALASVIGEMAVLSGDINDFVAQENARRGSSVKGLQMKRMNFGSPLYRITRIFLASLMADYTAERAIDALKRGEKPVILAENTIQAILEESYYHGDGAAPTFKDVLNRILTQLTKPRSSSEGDDDENIIGTSSLASSVQRVRGLIDELPDIPSSLIDTVKDKIKAAGYTVDEITGRTHCVIDGKIVPRGNRNNVKIKNDFNKGVYDAVVINSAGGTGIDLHASERFADQRPRVMIELQSPADVRKQIQAFGRITRYDDVAASRIELPSTGLPVEIRLAAMRNQKLRRLSANVTSNRDSIFLSRNIPDLINTVGDQVILKYAEMRPDLMKRLCLEFDTKKGSDASSATASEDKVDQERFANTFLSRLFLLTTEQQEKILSEVSAEYEMQIAEMEAKGENPLRPKELEGIVHIKGKRVFEGSDSQISSSGFDAPMHIMDVSIERVADPIRAEDVMRDVEKGIESHARAVQAVAEMSSDRGLYLKTLLSAEFRSVEHARNENDPKINHAIDNIDMIEASIAELVPGRQVEIDYDGEKKSAVITGVSVPISGMEHLPHMYRVSLAIPGETAIRVVGLSTLLKDFGVMDVASTNTSSPRFRVSPGLEGDNYDAVLDEFEAAKAKKIVNGKILTSNIFRAVRMASQHNLGNLVSFVDGEGNRHKGVLVKKSFDRKIENMATRVEGEAAILHALVDLRAELNSSPIESKKGLIISPVGQEMWQVRLPRPAKRRGELNWPSEYYRKTYEKASQIEKDHCCFRLTSEGELAEFIAEISETRFNAFYASSKFRGKLNQAQDYPANELGM